MLHSSKLKQTNRQKKSHKPNKQPTIFCKTVKCQDLASHGNGTKVGIKSKETQKSLVEVSGLEIS